MEQKGITYIIDKEQEVEDSWLGDPIRITQILNNLINNAYKFTETGSITLKISKISKSDIDDKTIVLLRFEVMDTGIGITEEQIEKYSRRSCRLTRQPRENTAEQGSDSAFPKTSPR